MTGKMLNRQSAKAHKEAEVQKAKVKKVSSWLKYTEAGHPTRKSRYRPDSCWKFDS
jgi:hypothetical protein